MATQPLIPKQMDVVLQDATLRMAGLQLSNPATQDPNYYGVRCDWQTTGQPLQALDESVIYVRAVEVDDAYNRVRDLKYSTSTDSDGDQVNTATTSYTRVWEVYWTCYGPNSFDNARIIRSALFQQNTKNVFANSNLYLVTDPAAPRRVPEYENGQWWDRTDFSARFNEAVQESINITTAASTEVIVETAGGIVSDVTVT